MDLIIFFRIINLFFYHFRWKSHEVSGVIRIEVHLFSGFEVMSVNPNEFEVNYGSRGDRVWFVVSNVSLIINGTECFFIK